MLPSSLMASVLALRVAVAVMLPTKLYMLGFCGLVLSNKVSSCAGVVTYMELHMRRMKMSRM